MFPVEYSKEKFLDGELITYTLLDVTDDSHWRQVTDEIIREPLAPIQYWINDNRNSFGNASIDTLHDVNRKLQEAGVEQLFYAMITEDPAYVPSNIVVNDLAAAEGYPVTAKLVGNKNAALRWFKELHGEKRGHKSN